MAPPETWRLTLTKRARRNRTRLVRNNPDLDRAIDRALDRIASNPYYDAVPPGAIKHLLGRVHCRREFRSLPGARRIFYRVHGAERLIEVYDIGDHPTGPRQYR